MRPQSLRAVLHLMCVYLYAMTAVEAGDIRTWRTTIYFDYENPKTPNFSPVPESRWHRFWNLPCISVRTPFSSTDGGSKKSSSLKWENGALPVSSPYQ